MLPILEDQVSKGIDRLISILKDKDNILKLLGIVLNQTQELENASYLFAEQKNIYTATGAWLDYIGSILAEDRQGRLDEDYRTALLLKIQINSNSGTPNEIIETVTSFTLGSNVRLRDFTIAAAVLYTNGTTNSKQELRSLISGIKPTGTRIIIHTDIADNAVLPSWEIVIPSPEFLEVFTSGMNEFLQVMVNGIPSNLQVNSLDDLVQYYNDTYTRSVPRWETSETLELFTSGVAEDFEVMINGQAEVLEIYTSNTTTDEFQLCWEVL